jgi:poly-gamma-glutamate synthesis protein (capsule biosynthesis protein)
VAHRDIETIQADIAKLRDNSAHVFVVVNLHWGTEKATTPDQEQIEFAHQVIDAGADIIIGHHPHVLQGIERYKSGVIAYSLGNFVFGGNSRDTYRTALFEVKLHNNSAEYRLIPVAIEKWHTHELSGAEGTDVLNRVEELSRIFPESIFSNKEVR